MFSLMNYFFYYKTYLFKNVLNNNNHNNLDIYIWTKYNKQNIYL